jgi:hypothetical protein
MRRFDSDPRLHFLIVIVRTALFSAEDFEATTFTQPNTT